MTRTSDLKITKRILNGHPGDEDGIQELESIGTNRDNWEKIMREAKKIHNGLYYEDAVTN